MGKRIMAVDDSPSFRIAVVTALSHVGYEMIEASDGNEALEKLHDEPVDLMIIDVTMPGMGGIELVKLIRTESEYMDIPIVMLTVQSAEIEKKIMRDAGATVWMSKPFKMLELIETVDKALA